MAELYDKEHPINEETYMQESEELQEEEVLQAEAKQDSKVSKPAADSSNSGLLQIVSVLAVIIVGCALVFWFLFPHGEGKSQDVRYVRGLDDSSVKPEESPEALAALDNKIQADLNSAVEATQAPNTQVEASPSPASQSQNQQLIIVWGDPASQNGTGTLVNPQASAPVPDSAFNQAQEAQGPDIRVSPDKQDSKAAVASSASAAQTQTKAPVKAVPPQSAKPQVVAAQKPPVHKAQTQNQEVLGKQFWIQIISSPNRDRVEQVMDQLADLGFKGRISSRTVEGTDFYRLRYGPYVSKDEAAKFLTWVQQIKGFEASYISEEYYSK